jgi:AraC-like DNA-binding protein
MAEPFIQKKLGDNDTIYFFMPHDFVDQRLMRNDSICARPVTVDNGIRRLVYDSVVSFQRDVSSMTDVEFRSAARILGELILLSFDGSADLTMDTRSVRTSSLARAKRIIRARLGDCEFCIADVARDCGISLRYLHELFRADGITVSEYLKQQRLQRARHMLENASPATTVTEVCLSCGFSNASQFSTAFRQAFSVSPRDVLRRIG